MEDQIDKCEGIINSAIILVLIKGLVAVERLIVHSFPHLNRERLDYELAYLLPWKDFLIS